MREEKIYNSQKSFSEQTGADPELLTHVFQKLIDAAIRIEKNLDQYRFEIKDTDLEAVEQALSFSDHILDDFISHMDSMKETLQKNGIAGNQHLATLSRCYKSMLADSDRDEL